MSSSLTLRSGHPEDAAACAAICFEAFGSLNRRHGFPPDFTDPQTTLGLMHFMLGQPFIYSVVAEENGQIVGSNFLWESGSIAGVGPITVSSGTQGKSVGRLLMEKALERARQGRFASVRLVQAAFNTTSMSLYTKLGFVVREPLVCLQGPPIKVSVPGIVVREATDADVQACGEVCQRVHGHRRDGELQAGIVQGTARIAQRGNEIAGYAADVGFFAHAVALDNATMMALIGAAEQISGPGLLLPSRNSEVFRWCLNNGLKMVEPMTLMSLGLYNEPSGAFLPSILF